MKCEVCGKEVNNQCYAGFEVCSSQCFATKYWLDKYKLYLKNDPELIVYNKEVYCICDEDVSKNLKGFDGEEFVVEFNDGRVIHTTNLWHNGRIPKIFEDLMPDNAKSLKPVYPSAIKAIEVKEQEVSKLFDSHFLKNNGGTNK